jgi:thiol:disulfide interchange protein DsbD
VQRTVRFFTAVSMLCLVSPTLASGTFGASQDAPSILPVDDAFQVTQPSPSTIRISVAPGTYLYDEKTFVQDASGQTLETVRPTPKMYDDPIFGMTPIHRQDVTLSLDAPGQSMTLHYQGCADIGFCYPPQQQELSISR